MTTASLQSVSEIRRFFRADRTSAYLVSSTAFEWREERARATSSLECERATGPALAHAYDPESRVAAFLVKWTYCFDRFQEGLRTIPLLESSAA